MPIVGKKDTTALVSRRTWEIRARRLSLSPRLLETAWVFAERPTTRFFNNPFALPTDPGYCKGMVDLKLQVPATDEVEVDAETLAAIDHGIKDANEGRTIPIDEVRKMIPKRISKFESQTPR
jgi:hypothetical protein